MHGSPPREVQLRRRRVVVIAVATAVLATVAAYGVAAATIWSSLTSVRGDCPAEWANNDPTGYKVPDGARNDVDWATYSTDAPQDVRFPSRTPGIEIAAWWIPSADETAPAVVVVHGHNACRRDPAVLLPAGMLARNGYSVLLIDLRDHGDSTLEDGRYAGGTEEYLDVLGAWDWVRAQGVAADRIGLLGISLGAATVLIAAGEEPRVAAVWEDSSFADIGVAIRAELARNGYPTFLEPGGIAMARLLSGDDLTSKSPLEGVRKLDGRPLFVTHGTEDSRLSVEYANDLIDAVEAQGGRVDAWIVDGAEHVQGMLLEPAEYEERLVQFFGEALGG